mgnify:FL=1
MADSVHIAGLDTFAQALKLLPNNISRRVLRGAVAAAGKVIRDEAKARAPVHSGPVAKGHPPPGTLKRAIALGRSNRLSKPGKEVFHVFVRNSAVAGSKGKKVIAGGKFDAYYWRYIEFGTSKMAARPFLRPAFEAKKEAAIEALTQYIAERFPQEAEKLGWKWIRK